tara:strand:- start:178 stop:519 length:342 start_codon:yes stop_codon:yes gene_type:complete
MNKEEKKVQVIMYIQDEYETEDCFKKTLPKNYLMDSNLPSHVLEEMKDPENSWCDLRGNVHFSKNYQPEPYVSNDNEVYLNLGSETMSDKGLVLNLMKQGMELIEEISEGEKS